MIYFESAEQYVSCGTSIRDKIRRINEIQEALETSALKAAAQGNITEYSLDDGQTKIRTVYRNASEIAASINAFETIKQRYINKLIGRGVRLMDGKNFNNQNNGR